MSSLYGGDVWRWSQRKKEVRKKLCNIDSKSNSRSMNWAPGCAAMIRVPVSLGGTAEPRMMWFIYGRCKGACLSNRMWPAWILWSRGHSPDKKDRGKSEVVSISYKSDGSSKAAKAEEIQHLQQRLERAESEPKLKAWWILVGCSVQKYYTLHTYIYYCVHTYLYIYIDISYIKICTCTSVVWVSVLKPPRMVMGVYCGGGGGAAAGIVLITYNW